MPKYVIITPARDEENYIEKTIRSVIKQTVKPAHWVIVNDGSSDNTGSIIGRYADQYNWITTVHRKDRGFRQAGGGVIETFYEGYSSLESTDFDFIVKMDGDLTFDDDYFERCFEHFEADPKLGIGGGDIYHIISGCMKLEKNPTFHVRGATKIYKKKCWNVLGGLIKAPGWDTIDEVKANMLGWKTKSFPDVKIIHLKYTGSADGAWKNCVKGGRAQYIAGYHPIFMLVRCLRRVTQKPYIMSSVGLFYGFISGYIKQIPQIDDKLLINYLRKQQLRRLFMKESIWK